MTDYSAAWPPRVDLTGSIYNNFYASCPVLAAQRPISYSVYSKLGDVLTSTGHPDKAREISYAGKVAQRRADFRDLSGFDLTGWLEWVTSLALDASIGYGYKMHRALAWALMLVFMGAAVFRSSPESKKNQMPYGFAYSFDMLLPIVKLRKKHEDIDLRGWRRPGSA